MKAYYKKPKLGSNQEHSKSILQGLAISLINSEAIETTSSRAKAVRSFVERLITLVRVNKLNAKRVVYARLHNQKAMDKLFNVLAPRLIKERSSGFISMYKLKNAKGNDALIYRVAFVDFVPVDKKVKKKKAKGKKTEVKKEERGENKGLLNRVRSLGRKDEGKVKTEQVSSTDKSKAKSRSGI
jgi:large subunit ribosomal protein L17